jgi:hypothetical protein
MRMRRKAKHALTATQPAAWGTGAVTEQAPVIHAVRAGDAAADKQAAA